MSHPDRNSQTSCCKTHTQGLMDDLRVKDLMSKGVITIDPESTMNDLMAVLNENKVSGVPVTKDGSMLGLVSIEDLVRALADKRHEENVTAYMTPSVISINPDDKAILAMKLLEEHGCGRLPVIDSHGLLVGIITKSDITKRLMSVLDGHSKSDESKKYRASHIFEDTLSDSTSLILRYHVAPKDFEEGGKASSTIKRMLERLGVSADLLKRITISAYEAEMNLIIHTDEGGDISAEICPERIVLTTQDKGPGIGDIQEALKPGFSTAPDWVRSLGFGAGMGLCNIKRYSDALSLVSEPGKGTVLTAAFEMKPGEPPKQSPAKTS